MKRKVFRCCECKDSATHFSFVRGVNDRMLQRRTDWMPVKPGETVTLPDAAYTISGSVTDIETGDGVNNNSS